MRLFEIHEQRWFPQFLRDQFVDGLQMILEVTSTYAPIAQLLWKRLEDSRTERVVDLCSGDRKSTRLNSSHLRTSRMPSSA